MLWNFRGLWLTGWDGWYSTLCRADTAGWGIRTLLRSCGAMEGKRGTWHSEGHVLWDFRGLWLTGSILLLYHVPLRYPGPPAHTISCASVLFVLFVLFVLYHAPTLCSAQSALPAGKDWCYFRISFLKLSSATTFRNSSPQGSVSSLA